MGKSEQIRQCGGNTQGMKGVKEILIEKPIGLRFQKF